jgi:hypothetical protein
MIYPFGNFMMMTKMNNSNSSIQLFIIYVLSHQTQGHLQTQHSVDTGNSNDDDDNNNKNSNSHYRHYHRHLLWVP